MPVRKLDPEQFVRAYNVDLQPLFPWEGVAEPPFGAAWAVLAPGESTKPHAHQECESFFVARGRGVLSIGDERHDVGPGSVSFHTPFDDHVLTNASDSEDLLFLTVFWEDRGQWRREEPLAESGPEVTRTLVTAAPPTPNGDLHVGHLAGPYLGADVHARYLRLRGVDARFVCGSDDNSPWVVAKAAELGTTPEETARRFTGSAVDTLERAGVELAAFPAARDSLDHREAVQEVFKALYERGELVEREVPTPFCPRCEEILVEHRVRGRCGRCDQPVTGNTCEECGWVNHGEEPRGAECTACGTPAEHRPHRRLLFPVARHAGRLREWYRRVEASTHLRSFCEEVLAEGPPELPVTQPGDWGIEVPVPGWEGERIYVWFEIAPRYLAYARHLSRNDGEGPEWSRWWNEPAARAVQFFGFDNSFYYGVSIPAVLLAFDPDIRLPDALVTNEFYRLDGQKFSTSRDHRILGRDLLAQVPVDAVRYHLAATGPEREQTNFTVEELRETCRRDLVDGLETWLGELAERVGERAGGLAPATGDWTPEHRRFLARLEGLWRDAGASYDARGFSPQRAVRTLAEIVREARRFGRGEVHWDRAASVRGEERRTALALELLAAKVFALTAAPILPGAACRIWRALGFTPDGQEGPAPGDWDGALDWVPAGHDVSGLAEEPIPGLREALDGMG